MNLRNILSQKFKKNQKHWKVHNLILFLEDIIKTAEIHSTWKAGSM